MKILVIGQNQKTIDLLTKYLGFNQVQADSIFAATNKDDIELLTEVYDFDLIFSEGFEKYLADMDVETIRLVSRKGRSTLSKLEDSYITKPVSLQDVKSVVVATQLAMAA